ncbi:MAG: hypothetical protein E7359_02345 [Clostridiales bacterium]|nr:hypothetical protein [Clostridiales bacterium]
MFKKKCQSTFLFILSLVCLLTLIIPFIGVGFIGKTSLALQIFYYIFLVIFCISLLIIIGLGIYGLFANDFSLIAIQEICAYIAFAMVLLNLLIFAPCLNCGLSIGYSILALEAFVMAFLSDIIKFIKKLPKVFNNIKNRISEKRKQKQELLLLEHNTEKIENNTEESEQLISSETIQDVNNVEIIPADDELI